MILIPITQITILETWYFRNDSRDRLIIWLFTHLKIDWTHIFSKIKAQSINTVMSNFKYLDFSSLQLAEITQHFFDFNTV